MSERTQQIEQRLAQMPRSYRATYDKTVKGNKAREYFASCEDVQKVLDTCPIASGVLSLLWHVTGAYDARLRFWRSARRKGKVLSRTTPRRTPSKTQFYGVILLSAEHYRKLQWAIQDSNL
jgi:hypothetical protein